MSCHPIPESNAVQELRSVVAAVLLLLTAPARGLVSALTLASSMAVLPLDHLVRLVARLVASLVALIVLLTPWAVAALLPGVLSSAVADALAV